MAAHSAEAWSEEDTRDSILVIMKAILGQRYLNPHESITKFSGNIHICLIDWKVKRPDLFRTEARIYRAEFDELVH